MATTYYQSPRWSNEIADCSMPMTFDTYSNCAFGCLYCFSQFQRGIGGAKDAYLQKVCNNVNPNRIKRMFTPTSMQGSLPRTSRRERSCSGAVSLTSSTASSVRGA